MILHTHGLSACLSAAASRHCETVLSLFHMPHLSATSTSLSPPAARTQLGLTCCRVVLLKLGLRLCASGLLSEGLLLAFGSLATLLYPRA